MFVLQLLLFKTTYPLRIFDILYCEQRHGAIQNHFTPTHTNVTVYHEATRVSDYRYFELYRKIHILALI